MTQQIEVQIAMAIAAERRSLRPEVRASADEVSDLLDAEFREIGASGRLWYREAIIEALSGDVAAPAAQIREEDM